MTLLPTIRLRPTSGQIFYTEILLIKNNKRLLVQDFDFSKDITGPTGDGKMTIAFFSGYDTYMAEGDQFQVFGAWMPTADPNKLNTVGTSVEVNPIEGMSPIGASMGAKPFLLTTPPTDEIVHGVIKKIKASRTTIEIDFTDMGILLEATAIFSQGVNNWGIFDGTFTNWSRHDIIEYVIGWSGLNPIVNVSGGNNDIIPNWAPPLAAANAANSGETQVNTVCMVGRPSVKPYPSGVTYRFYQTCVQNHCPNCGKDGTLGDANKPQSYGDGEYTCLSSKGGCDTDWDVVSGKIKVSGDNRKLNVVKGPIPTQGPQRLISNSSVDQINVATIENDTGDTNNGSSLTTSNTSWWDLLVGLINPIQGDPGNTSGPDLEIYVKGTNVIVTQPPDPSAAVLLAQDGLNIIAGSMIVTEADPNCPNTVIVNYGKTIIPQYVTTEKVSKKGKVTYKTKTVKTTEYGTSQATATESGMVTEYGTIVQKYDKYNYTEEQAIIYAEKMLRKLERLNGFELDCTVIGTTDWYVGQWVRFIHSSMGINDTYFITKTDFKIDKGSSPKIDLTLSDYIPDLSGGDNSGATADPNNTTSGSTTTSIDAALNTIGTKEAKFLDCQPGTVDHPTSNENDNDLYGCSDCWGDSAWLYQNFTAAGIQARIMACTGGKHRYCEYLDNGTWTVFPGYLDTGRKWGGHHWGPAAAKGSIFVYKSS